MLGVELGYGLSLERTSTWLVGEGLRILLIAALAYFATRVASLGIDHFEAVVADRGSDNRDTLDFANRLHTIGGLVKNAVNVLVIGAATLMILEEFGVNITPLLTAAGIGGLAVGFGAQNLVRDVISGFFLILEDQIHVGDVVKIDDTSGLVESVKLRTVVLRDLSGTVHIIPNGSITTLSNMSKEFSYSVMDVGVAYKEDTDTVVDVLRDVGADIQSDKDFGQHILDELEVLGVDDFADSAVTIKIRIKTRPLKQWMVGRELRRRIKKAFDTAGIEIPFPHISLYMGEVSNPFLTRPMTASEEVDLAAKRAQQATVRQTSTRRRTSSARDASDTEGLGDVG
jgi:small conductance mechanosensitive channel